jgi:hypothetical protein
MERAVTAGTRDAGRRLKTELAVRSTAPGSERIDNSWSDRHHSTKTPV